MNNTIRRSLMALLLVHVSTVFLSLVVGCATSSDVRRLDAVDESIKKTIDELVLKRLELRNEMLSAIIMQERGQKDNLAKVEHLKQRLSEVDRLLESYGALLDNIKGIRARNSRCDDALDALDVKWKELNDKYRRNVIRDESTI